MAGVHFTVSTPEQQTGTAVKTLLQIEAPANQRVKVSAFGVYFKGVEPADPPVRVRLLFQTADTGSGSSSVTPTKINGASETVQTTATRNYTGGASDPTAGAVVFPPEAHPQSFYEKILPEGKEIEVPGGSALGLEVLSTVDIVATAYMQCEE